jgi:hypothetical protein
MEADPFTIKIFVPSGDPEGVRIVEMMNWTGKGIVFPRIEWDRVGQRTEFQQAGIYFLVGQEENDDLPSVYIGQTDVLRTRLDKHNKDVPFWDRAIVFVSSSNSLNRGHITWLEHALIARADQIGLCHLKNNASPNEPSLSESEKADTRSFLKQVLQILPLVGLRALDKPRSIVASKTSEPETDKSETLDTVVVPAQEDGFKEVFLGQNCWYAIRISGDMLPKIRYIAGYVSKPVSAITHYAVVERIEPYGENGKYRLFFSGKAKEIGPIRFEDAQPGSMQSPRYTSITKLKKAKNLSELFS